MFYYALPTIWSLYNSCFIFRMVLYFYLAVNIPDRKYNWKVNLSNKNIWLYKKRNYFKIII